METCLRLCDLAEAQLKAGLILEAARTEMQIAEIQLKSLGPQAHIPWGWVPGMASPWEVSTSRRETSPEQAQKVDAEPTIEELMTPKSDLATFLKELEEQHRAALNLKKAVGGK